MTDTIMGACLWISLLMGFGLGFYWGRKKNAIVRWVAALIGGALGGRAYTAIVIIALTL